MTKDVEKENVVHVNDFMPLEGQWKLHNNVITYSGPIDKNTPGHFGLVLFRYTLKNGSIKAKINFKERCYARLVIGYDPRTKEYYSIGIGGYNYFYIIDKFEEGKGWRALQFSGLNQIIDENRIYEVEVNLEGQKVTLIIDGVTIFNFLLPEPLNGIQTGLFAWGDGKVEFSDITIDKTEDKAKAFVIMQFSEPSKSLYEEVIINICKEMNLFVYKADEIYKPGFILNDIIWGILSSEIIIADITPENANVFYELGYAHAFNKPTILLAQRGTPLPFDVSGYRVIFYDDSIKGKREIEEQLRKHLKNIIK